MLVKVLKFISYFKISDDKKKLLDLVNNTLFFSFFAMLHSHFLLHMLPSCSGLVHEIPDRDTHTENLPLEHFIFSIHLLAFVVKPYVMSV